MDSTSVTIETDIGKILIGCFYRSASLNDSQNTEFFKYFCSKISSDNNVEKVIFGDFNCPDISWLSGNVAGPADTINKSLLCQRSFLDIVHEYGLSWLITNEITRRRKVGNVVQESTIDQVLLSEESLVSEFKISQPLVKSDHVTIVTDLNIYKRDGSHCYDVDDVRRNWAKTEPPELLELSYKIYWNYSKKLDEMSVDEVWEEVHGKLNEITECIPCVKPSNPDRIDNYNMPWINSSLKRAIRNKNKAWAAFDNCPSISSFSLALSKQDIYANFEIKAKLKYEKLITNDLKHNSKAFYAYLRNRCKVKSVVTTLKKDKQLGSLTQNDFETAECFEDAFSSVFVQEPLGPLPKCCYTNNADFKSEIGSEIIITEEDVFNELKSLNIYKSFGPDQVHPKLLHALADNNSFVRCIMHLFSKCIKESVHYKYILRSLQLRLLFLVALYICNR